MVWLTALAFMRSSYSLTNLAAGLVKIANCEVEVLHRNLAGTGIV